MMIDGDGMDRTRVRLYENFEKAPQLSAVTQLPSGDTYNTATFLASIAANRYFEVLGTSAVSADVGVGAEGGITVATHGAQNDSTIILPHLTSNQSPWTNWKPFGTDRSCRWGITFRTPAAVTALKIWAGLKKTNTPTVATDTDQVFFKYDSAVSTDATLWHTIYSISDTDTEVGVGAAVAAATDYYLAIEIDSNRIAKMYINGQLLTTSTALASLDLIPYFGILDTSSGSARTAIVTHMSGSRLVGA